eukprot:4649590-Pyramimonas_sp.AAC.1
MLTCAACAKRSQVDAATAAMEQSVDKASEDARAEMERKVQALQVKIDEAKAEASKALVANKAVLDKPLEEAKVQTDTRPSSRCKIDKIIHNT